MASLLRPDTWLYPTGRGLYCAPGDFYIDPGRRVDRAVVTHGHGDHARPRNVSVLATAETIEIMKVRYGARAAQRFQTAVPGEAVSINGVTVTLVPAGHILGSAQAVLEWQGQRIVVSGDYKRRRDPTCELFEPVRCDVFITEATFGLPIFRHEPDAREIGRFLASCRMFPDRTHLVGAYGLGKCQRFIALLRDAGYDAPVWLHSGMLALCALYGDFGIDLGDIRPVSEARKNDLAGGVVIAPPGEASGRLARRVSDPVNVFASGWMRVRAHARRRGVELPLVLSDHADWPEIIETVRDTGAEEVWVTHGREEALLHQMTRMGVNGRALSSVGRDGRVS